MVGSRLVLTFGTSDSTTTHSFSYANADATAANVKALANGIIANGSIYAKIPLTAKSAKIVTTTETDYNLSA